MNNMKYIFILFSAIALALTVHSYRKKVTTSHPDK